MSRVYLDHNATMPLRPEARAAMQSAMDILGNPSSVHTEGRAAKALIETSRAEIAEAFGASGADIVFTGSATEAAALACAGRVFSGAGIEHDAVAVWMNDTLPVDNLGQVKVSAPRDAAVQSANSETGIVQDLPQGLAVCDMTQTAGKSALSFSWTGAQMGILSGHKLGGPKGIGILILRQGLDVSAQIKGGGQEMGRRSGTENVIGIAGFAAAAKAAIKELNDGVWDRVAELRNILEKVIVAEAKNTVPVGNEVRRLPNTSCLLTPGWKGETQVMRMDLAGFAISAGSACSSGKVKASRVLRAMGFDERAAGSAIRVSLGPGTTEDEIMRFAETWLAAEKKFHAKAA